MADVIQIRRDTAANWTSVNPVLHQGEHGLETDTGKEKIGDGVTAWNSLAYAFVRATGDETIAGVKTFSSAPIVPNGDSSGEAVNFGQLNAATTPAGMITMYGASSAPSGWLLCQGSAVSRTTYSKLFAVIGTSFGIGDGSTTFNLPNFNEASPVGIGTRESGVTAHDTFTLAQFKDDQMQGHFHDLYAANSGSGGTRVFQTITSAFTGISSSFQTSDKAGNATSDGTNGTPRTGAVTRGKCYGIYFIIKT